MWWLLAGCAPVEPVLVAVTDGGTWTVELLETPDLRGIHDLPFAVYPADGELATLHATMPDMGHTSDGVVTDLGDGAYSVEVNFTMPGWWVLDGVVQRDTLEEAVRLEVEVP